MKISIVIPAYNEEAYLPKTLASIRELDPTPDEVIVVDASSTDKTAKIAKEWGATVLTVEKKTIAFSRQKGLEAAKADIVACTDADDILPKNWLSQIERALSSPGVVGVYGIYLIEGGPWLYRAYINSINPLVLWLASKVGVHMAVGQNMAFWKEQALKVGGFPVTFKTVEDVEMIHRLKTVGRIIFLPHFAVTTSGRRGKEGLGVIIRVLGELFVYFLGKTQEKNFPTIR